jgi:hypothetical protein
MNNILKLLFGIIAILFIIFTLFYLFYKKEYYIALIDSLSIYNIINLIFICSNYINLKFRKYHLLSILIIPVILFIILPIYNHFMNQTNSILIVIFILYSIFILFFVNGMNAKRICGKSMGLLELFNFDIFNYYKIIDDKKYIEKLKKYVCFNDDELTDIKSNNKFTFENTKNINNLNSNYYNLTSKIQPHENYKFNIRKQNSVNENTEGGNMNPMINNNNNNSVKHFNTGKYITLTIYNLIIIGLQILHFFKIENNQKILKFCFTLLFALTIFIWVCVLNYPIWIIILFIIIILVVWIAIGLMSAVGHKGDNLGEDYLCQLHIIPIVNKTWANISFNDNFNRCMNSGKQSFFLKIFGPYIKIINNLETQLSEQNSKLNNISTIIVNLKEKINIMIEEIYNKIKQIEQKIVQISNKIFEIFQNIFNIFKFIIYGLISLLQTFTSIINTLNSFSYKIEHPISTMFCFDEETKIKLFNNEEKNIIDIKINDILIDGTRVLGVLKFKYSNEPMYKYKDIIVSGSHYVFDNNIHKKVSDCESSVAIPYDKEYIYSLITNTQKIIINDIIFSDYFDINNNIIQNKIQNKILSLLNNFEINDYCQDRLPLWGFYKNTKIKMRNNEDKIISHIKIGDLTEYGKVTSIVKLKIDNPYKYKNIITSGDQIVKENNIWIRVKDCMLANRCYVDDKIFYHISVETNKLKINNDLFTDFEQISNYGYFEFTNLVNL